MKLAENWRELWKKYSTVALALLTAFPTAWASFPELQSAIPAAWALKIVTFIAIIGFIGRYVDQTKKNLENQDGE